MIDMDAITGFDWDKGNARKSSDKHGVTQTQAEQVFFNQPILVLEDTKHSRTEIRFHALGQTDEKRFLHVTFTLRATLIRIISARDISQKERQRYGHA